MFDDVIVGEGNRNLLRRRRQSREEMGLGLEGKKGIERISVVSGESRNGLRESERVLKREQGKKE